MALKGFAQSVKSSMAHYFPTWKLDSQTAGAGPSLTYVKPVNQQYANVREMIYFSQGLNFPSVEIDFQVSYSSQIGTGRKYEFLFTLESTGQSEFGTSAEFERWFSANAKNLEAKFDKCYKSFHADYQALENLMVCIMEQYKAWYGTAKPKFTNDELLDLEKTRNDAEYESFCHYLRKEKLLPKKQFFEIVVTQWFDQRPKRREDFEELYIGNDCGICGENKERGKFIDEIDPIFGPHCEFICSSCLKEKSVLI